MENVMEHQLGGSWMINLETRGSGCDLLCYYSKIFLLESLFW